MRYIKINPKNEKGNVINSATPSNINFGAKMFHIIKWRE